MIPTREIVTRLYQKISANEAAFIRVDSAVYSIMDKDDIDKNGILAFDKHGQDKFFKWADVDAVLEAKEHVDYCDACDRTSDQCICEEEDCTCSKFAEASGKTTVSGQSAGGPGWGATQGAGHSVAPFQTPLGLGSFTSKKPKKITGKGKSAEYCGSDVVDTDLDHHRSKYDPGGMGSATTTRLKPRVHPLDAAAGADPCRTFAKGMVQELDFRGLTNDDYQRRRGNAPKPNIPDTIQGYQGGLEFMFKSTKSQKAHDWVQRWLSQNNIKYKTIEADQAGDYQDDWIRVEVSEAVMAVGKAGSTESPPWALIPNKEDNLKYLKLGNKALRAFPSSPKQQEITRQMNDIRKKYGLKLIPMREATLAFGIPSLDNRFGGSSREGIFFREEDDGTDAMEIGKNHFDTTNDKIKPEFDYGENEYIRNMKDKDFGNEQVAKRQREELQAIKDYINFDDNDRWAPEYKILLRKLKKPHNI